MVVVSVSIGGVWRTGVEITAETTWRQLKALIEDKIQVRDLPEVWNTKMQQYLGLSTKGNDAMGCMQDIHWTDGSFGYFPSYTLGAIYAAQFAGALIQPAI